ncbi:B3/4 domain-containing protein [Actinomadura viridis]|uniref:B3/B4 domain-containing protein n=1 Tax=Actinomadura viridis TaxID=58110 RepID=UPI0036CA615B
MGQDLTIMIDPALREAAPRLRLGVITGRVGAPSPGAASGATSGAASGNAPADGPGGASAGALDAAVEREVARVTAELELGEVAAAPEPAALRRAYRALGRDPQRYRGSAEALLRRVLRGQGLYRINPVVDVNNLVSLRSTCAVGTYDLDAVEGDITFRPGGEESYQAIGKGALKLAGLPVFADARGPFGSPTSDSERTMIRPGTGRIVMVVIAFAGGDPWPRWRDFAVAALREFAGGRDLETTLVT